MEKELELVKTKLELAQKMKGGEETEAGDEEEGGVVQSRTA